MSIEVSRPSHSHHVPQVGRPQIEPVIRQIAAKVAPAGRNRAAGNRRKRMAPDELADRGGGNAEPSSHPEPRRRARGCRGSGPSRPADNRAASASARRHSDRRQQQANQQQPGRRGPREAQETCGIGERVHCALSLMPFRSAAAPWRRRLRRDRGRCCALSAQICSSRTGIPSIRWRTRLASPSPRYSVQTLMMPPALMT